MRSLTVLSAAALVAALLCGCGANARSAAPPPSTVRHALAHSPAPLAALHAQADQLLGGGPKAFEARLKALRGYPVVVNMWASWCGPCKSEFPSYQRAAVAYGRRVAFVGLDAKDTNASAAGFLKRFPVTYPSYTDPANSIQAAIGAYPGYPQTFFFDRKGQKVYDKAGPYLTVAELERDIRQYALG